MNNVGIFYLINSFLHFSLLVLNSSLDSLESFGYILDESDDDV